MTKIIAFAGKKQSGKTTCSEFVLKYFNGIIEPFNGGKIYNFADTLKQDICMNILGMSYDQCYGTDDQKNQLTDIEWNGSNLTAREVMQFVGTDIFRKMKNNVWVDATINKIKIEQPKIAIIADCRFPNEVNSIKQNNGIVIKLSRDLYHSNHESELALDGNNYNQNNFDTIIYNEKLSIAEQNRAVLNFLQIKGVL